MSCGDDVGPDPAEDASAEAGEADARPDLPEGSRVSVAVDPSRVAGVLHPRYLGFALDTAQLTGGMWWSAGAEARGPTPMPDLEDPTLRRLAQQLAPSLMRIGGTDCDAAYFCPVPGPCELPEAYRGVYRDEDRVATVLTQESLRRAADFAEAVGAQVLLCVNLGPGPRHPETGEWSDENARQLLAFLDSLPNSDVFVAFEPGNEINAAFAQFQTPYTIDPERFAGDLERFAAAVDERFPEALLVAPGSYISPLGEFQDFTSALMTELASRATDPLDAVSFHLYATQSTSCPLQIDPATAENLFDETLNERHRGVAEGIREAAAGLPVWNTESASAQCGGQAGLSDGLADALWYADWIGLMAQAGTSLTVRHSLVGADYSLLEPDTFAPRPTFLALVMMRRLVAGPRLATETDRTQLKAHAYCSAGAAEELTVVLANPGPEPQVAELEVAGGQVLAAQQWTLGGEGLTGGSARIEGEAALPDGTIPDPPPRPVAVRGGRAYPLVDSASLVFAVIETDASTPCQTR